MRDQMPNVQKKKLKLMYCHRVVLERERERESN